MHYQILVFITHVKNIKSSCNNNKFKKSTPTLNDKFEIPDDSYSISNIQDYFEYILKKHGENIDKPSVQMYVNKIENRVTFKIKDGYSLEHWISETMKLLGSNKNQTTKDRNGENVPQLEITEVILVFFYQGFLSQTLTTHRTAEEGKGPSFIPLYHFHSLTNIQAFSCNFVCEMTITYF